VRPFVGVSAERMRIFLLLRFQFIAEDRDGIERFRPTDHIGREDRGEATAGEDQRETAPWPRGLASRADKSHLVVLSSS